MGIIVERSHDDAGIIWPVSVAPLQAHLIELGGTSAADIYKDLAGQGIEVLYDDRGLCGGKAR